MRSSALTLTLALPLFALVSGCAQSEGDYAVAMTWAINGMLPTPALCAEQGIARGRLDVRTASGKQVRTLETDCAATVAVDDGTGNGTTVLFGGFVTSYAFEYDVDYRYTISLVDANGNPRADPISDALFYEDRDVTELPSIDYLQPNGNVAGLHAEWDITGAADLAALKATCDAKRVQTVRLLVTTILDVDFVNEISLVEAPCGDGSYTSNGKTLASGAYVMRYQALGPTGSSVAVGEPIEVEVDGTGDIVLPRETFRL